PGDSGTQLMQKITFGLGTLASMATGLALKYPEGALAAWTGALQGWAEGDAIRGNREFETWVAKVREGHRAHQSEVERWQALREKYKDNMEQLKTEGAILLHKQGASKELIEAMLKGPETQWKALDAQTSMWDKMLTHTTQATLKLIAQQSLDEQRRFMNETRVWNAKFRLMQHNSNAAFKQAALNLMGDTKLGPMITSADKFISSINEIDVAYQNLVKKMSDRGQAHLIPKGATRFDQWSAEIGRYLNPNDP